MTVTVADHIRWMGQMTQGSRYGATAGDSFHQGTYDYATSRPYPNGLPVVPGGMSDCEAGRRMIDKARRDSSEHSADMRVRQITESITSDVLSVFLSSARIG